MLFKYVSINKMTAFVAISSSDISYFCEVKVVTVGVWALAFAVLLPCCISPLVEGAPFHLICNKLLRPFGRKECGIGTFVSWSVLVYILPQWKLESYA